MIISATVAVDGFFSLSGFIMTHIYEEKFWEYMKNFKSEKKKFFIFYLKFLIYRIGRLYPLLFLACTIPFFTYYIT